MIEESLFRIGRCLELVSEEDVWHRFNDQSNTIGNLILHLTGNIRQWIISGLGGMPDLRMRDSEFIAGHNYPKEELFIGLKDTIERAVLIIENLPEEEFLKKHNVQIYKETGIAIIIHVIEHLSYHVGQITTITKILTGKDTGYYEGQKL